jgi:hypothetical protein
MISLDDLAIAALSRDALQLRSLVQDLIRGGQNLSAITPPKTQDARLLSVAAAIVELLAERTNQAAPAWTATVGAVSEPVYLVAAAERLSSMRQLCDEESPEPLKRRRLFAPPNYLAWA